MKQTISQFERDNLFKALNLFIEAVRDYIIRLLSQKFGEDQWETRYKEMLDADLLKRFERDRNGTYNPRDLIDYGTLGTFCSRYRDLLKPDFKGEASAWASNFRNIAKVRNYVNHFQGSIAKDQLKEFWILTRRFAEGTQNKELLATLWELEEAVPGQTAPSQADKPQETRASALPIPNARYFLPVLIRGQKAHVVHLCVEGETSHTLTRSFIFEQNTDKILLFRLIEGAFQGRSSHDRHHTCLIEKVSVENSTLWVDLTAVPVASPSEPGVGIGGTGTSDEIPIVKYDLSGKNQEVYAPLLANYTRIAFRLTKDGQCFLGEIKTHFAPPRQIVDIALDFGSEASQGVIHFRNEEKVLHRVNLVEQMRSHFFSDLRGILHQKDADNELFRSQVFVRKNGVVMHPYARPNQHNGQELIPTLTEKSSIDELKKTHVLIPNTKLAHLGVYNFSVRYKDRDSNPDRLEESPFGVLVQDIQQTVINHFLHTLLASVHAGKNDKKMRFIHIRYLVPNVLEQERLTRLINQTYQFLDTPEIRQKYNLGGAEVNTLSESDASFLGYWAKTGLSRQSANYLIVDMGKGTTDFSIIRSDDEYNLSSEYRSGFIGAGNVITYAFIDTLIAALLGSDPSWEERRSALKIMASNQSDISSKYEFLEMIESIKYKFGQDSTPLAYIKDLAPAQLMSDIQTIVREQKAQSNLLRTVIDALRMVLAKQATIRDEFGFINHAVQKIADKLRKELLLADPENVGVNFEKLNRIVLTGRGFLFSRIVHELDEKLIKSTGQQNRLLIMDIQNREDHGNELKKICMSGALSGRLINYDSNLVGIPHLHSLVRVREGNREISRRTIQKGAGDRKPRTFLDTSLESFHKFLSGFSDEDYIEMTDPALPAPSAPASPSGKLPPILEFLTRGARFDDPFNRNIHTLHVSGVMYHCDKLNNGDTIDLLFDGEEFWLRTDTGLAALSYYPDFLIKDSMIWQTLFPFFDAVSDTHTPINTQLADNDSEI